MTDPSHVVDNRRSPLETPMLLVGVRCTARYVVLPLLLPLLGTAAGAALGVVLLIDAVAVVSIVASLRRMWRLRDRRRWHYLPLGLTLILLVVLAFVSDTRALDG